MRARSEKEASEADLQASKMQVEAADAAEDTKKHLEEPKTFARAMYNRLKHGVQSLKGKYCYGKRR
ncbi:hypothetical protein RJ640_005938 [Escallonia rubra]|uniref:Uncharacterized protein n=1 Tax=Escallonia rubra TaxID=112253 RepID=A0AA88UGD4_9ASTE|nr:hypothetical protein RJ640_005938 [Escallonia rubra]